MIVVNDQCPIGHKARLKTVATENIGDSFKSHPGPLEGCLKAGANRSAAPMDRKALCRCFLWRNPQKRIENNHPRSRVYAVTAYTSQYSRGFARQVSITICSPSCRVVYRSSSMPICEIPANCTDLCQRLVMCSLPRSPA